MEDKIVIIGSGLTGSYFARELAENGEDVLVLEKNAHVGGQLYDYIDKDTNCLVSKYGPHIFHTSNQHVWNWVRQFSEFEPYELRNRTYLDFEEKSGFYEMPFGTHTAKSLLTSAEYNEYLRAIVEEFPGKISVSVSELLDSKVPIIKKFANLIWELNYKLYTSKQWGISPNEVDSSVLKRVPVYLSHYNRYFNDSYEGIPKGGYTKFIEKILNHKNINIKLNTKPNVEIKENKCIVDGIYYKKVIFTGPVDSLFNYKYGELGYRSLKFEFFKEKMNSNLYFGMPSVDTYPSHKFKWTRITHYGLLPLQKDLSYQISAKEYSFKYNPYNKENNPYYPISTKEDKKLLSKYLEESNNINNLILAGRLGTYKYYNMDKAIEEAMKLFKIKFNKK